MNKVFIDLGEDRCEGIWIGKNINEDDLKSIDGNVIIRGKFEIEGDVFNYVKIFY